MQLPAQIAAVEIGDDAVRVIVVRTGGRVPRVLELAQASIGGSGPEAAAIAAREAVSRLKAKPAAFVLSAPASWSVLRLMQVPFRSHRKIAAAVPFELEPTLAFPIEDLVVDFLPVRQVGAGTEVLAVGVRRASIEQTVDALGSAGLRIDGVYLDALALTSLWAGLSKKESAPRAVLHFRPREAVLGVVESGTLAYLRRLDMDPGEFRANPSGVAREVRNLLRSFGAERGENGGVQALSVTGAQLHEAGRTIFEAEIDVPVRYDDLANELPGFADKAGASEDEFNLWSTPIATAYSAAGGPFAMNFEQATVAGSGLSRIALRTCLAGAVVLVAYLGLVSFDYFKDRGALNDIGAAVWAEYESTYPETAGTRPPNDVGGVASMALLQEAALAESDQSQGVSLERFSAPPLLDVLVEISAVLGPDVAAIQQIEIRPLRSGEGREITIQGTVLDSGKYNAALDALEKSSLIKLDRETARRTSSGGTDTFSLKAKVG